MATRDAAAAAAGIATAVISNAAISTASTLIPHLSAVSKIAVSGIVLAAGAGATWIRYLDSASALCRIKNAPFVSISGLSLLLNPSSGDREGMLVVVRGLVQSEGLLETSWDGVKNYLISQWSEERAVVIQRNQNCMYKKWRGLLQCEFSIVRTIFANVFANVFANIFGETPKKKGSTSLRSVPFILVGYDDSGHIHISLEGSNHPLPLTNVYHRVRRVHDKEYPLSTFYNAIFGNWYPVAIVDEENILPVGKEITAVGICRLHDGAFKIKSCAELPCFLSNRTKDVIEADLARGNRLLFWTGVVLSTLSICTLGYAASRKWIEWRQRRRLLTQELFLSNGEETVDISDEELGDIPDEELCVICLTRERRYFFVPCGHQVCCRRCAILVRLTTSPKCPICEQRIQSSIRAYDS